MYPKHDSINKDKELESTMQKNEFQDLNTVSIYGCPAPPNEISPRVEPYKKPDDWFDPTIEMIEERRLKILQNLLPQVQTFFIAEGRHNPVNSVAWTCLTAKSIEEAVLAYAKSKQFGEETEITVISFGSIFSHFSVEPSWKLTQLY